MSQNKPHETPPEDRVSRTHKLGFGLGAVSECIMGNSIGQMANYVLNLGLGVRPELVGWLLALPRIWDAISDPIIGAWSDNIRTRWGRRKPFVFAGAILSGIIFAAMWLLPRGWSEMAYFWYFLGMSLLYYTAFTLWVVPWSALGCEMTEDYNERTSVMAYRTFFMSVGGFVPAWLFALTKLPIFTDVVQGARYVGTGTALVMIIFGLIPVFLAPERYDAKIRKQKKIGFITSMKATLSNKPFLLMNTIVLIVCAGLFMINGLDPYITIYHVWGGDQAAASVWIGWSALAYQMSGILFVFPVSWAAKKWGKKAALSFFLIVSFVAALLKWVCFNPNHPWTVLIPSFLMASGLTALWTITNSMMADICDVGELDTGKRMEGAFNAVGGWIRKMGISLAFLVSGYVIAWTGFSAELGSGQSASTILWMRILAVSVPSVMILIALALIPFYTITEEKAHDIRSQLKQRKDQK